MLDLRFSETLQSLSSFKQLLFSSFHRGNQRKKSKTGESPLLSIFVFPIWYPHMKISFTIVTFLNLGSLEAASEDTMKLRELIDKSNESLEPYLFGGFEFWNFYAPRTDRMLTVPQKAQI